MQAAFGERWKAIEELFLEASELPRERRGPFLEERCHGDSALKAEVERLLANTESIGFSAIVGSAAEDFANTDDWVGRQIGVYRLAERIGSGGMGSVYRAVRADDYHKEVAIKLLRFDAGDDHARARFRRERQILALLEHPNIARLLDGGRTDSGSPYLVMEYVVGEALLPYCSRLSLKQKLILFCELCDAVQFAHQRLIIHRDIKPGNILVSADGVPKLLDFGIAKILDADTEGEALTSTRIMTPEYASPEQVRGDPVTTATDVYALGCVLYEMLTGERFHKLTTRDPLEVARVVCLSEPRLPSSTGHAHLRGDLDTILLKALQKEPSRRYRSAQELSDDLRRFLDGLPVLARPDSVIYRVRKYVRRNRLMVGAATAIIAALAVGLWTTRQQAQIAERRFAQTRGLANRLLFDVYSRVENIPGGLDARQAIVTTALEYLDGLSREAGSDPDLSWELAQAYMRVAGVQGPYGPNLGRPRDAMLTMEKALALHEKLLQGGHLTDARKKAFVSAYQDYTQWCIIVSEQAKAAAAAEKARALSRDLPPIVQAKALDAIGQVQAASGKLPEAIESFTQAVSLARQGLNDASPMEDWRSLDGLMDRRGKNLILVGRLEEAATNYRDALSIAESLLAKHPNNVKILHFLALGHEMLGTVLGLPDRPNLGRRKEGIAEIDRALAAIAPVLKADSQSGALHRQESILWGKRAAMQTDIHEALRDLQKSGLSIDGIPEPRERDHVRIAYLSDLAFYSLKLNRVSEARAALQESIMIAERQRAREPNDTMAIRSHGIALVDAAELDATTGRASEAEGRFDLGIQLLTEAERRVPTDARYITALASCMETRAKFWQKKGRAEKARESRVALLSLLQERAKSLPKSKPIARLIASTEAALRER